MNLGIKDNMKIAEKYCLNPEGCPKLKGITDYNEKLSKCAGCTNYLNKIDLVELLRELHNTAPTSTSSQSKSRRNTNGKNTELNKSEIKKILELNDSGYTINGICVELGLQYRTVKNVLTLGFKNEASNEKVRNVMKELES